MITWDGDHTDILMEMGYPGFGTSDFIRVNPILCYEPWDPFILIDDKKKHELYLNALPGKSPPVPAPLATRQPVIKNIQHHVRHQRYFR